MGTRYLDVKAIFEQAVEKTGGERSDYLDMACGSDSELRTRVEDLFKAHEDAGNFLHNGPIDAAAVASSPTPAEGPGTVISRYKLLQEIGEGGFGVVYMAEQQEPVIRKVALKIIKLGMDTRQVIVRFEAERQALAIMDHPNIAKVHDGGATETGRPYFVMELVRGIPITEYCEKNNLTTNERLELFVDVCRAVQHAHQKGIIHRDIKPTNVMVTLNDGQPMPKVIDFGIAKATEHRLTEKTLYTDYHQFIGTPQYMSPEQATMSNRDVDTRTDVYSLGVLLYELLVGSTPFQPDELREAGYDAMCRIIRESDPPTPSRRLSTLGEAATTEVSRHRQAQPSALRRQLRGDLDWIVMKALEKDRNRRYETSSDFAADVERYLTGEAVEARHASAAYTFGKFARRNRTILTTAALVASALLMGTVVSVLLAATATIERNIAEEARHREFTARSELETQHKQLVQQKEETDKARRRAEDLRYASDMNRAVEALTDRDLRLVRRLLREHHSSADGADRRGWGWYYLWHACRDHVPTLCHDDIVNTIAVSPDGRWLVSGDTAGNLSVWNVSTRKQLSQVKAHRHYVLNVEFSPDGRILASSGGDNSVRLWRMDPDQPTPVGQMELEGDIPLTNWQCVAVSHDGKLVATGGHEFTLRLWDVSTGEKVAEIPKQGVLALAFHPDGRALAAHGWDKVAIWRLPLDPEEPPWVITDYDNIAWVGLAFSPDGRSIAASWKLDGVELWDVVDRKRLHQLVPSTPSKATSVAFSPDGKTLAVANWDKTVRLWDTATGQQVQELVGHSSPVTCVRFTADGKTLASSSLDKTVRLWPLSDDGTEQEQPHTHPLGAASFSPDGMWMATADAMWSSTSEGKVVLWETQTWRPVHEFVGKTLAFSHDSMILAIGGNRGRAVQLWDLQGGAFLPPLPQTDSGTQTPLAFSPDGHLAVGAKRALQLWDPREPEKPIAEYRGLEPPLNLSPRSIMRMAFAPDGGTLAVTINAGDIALFDGTTLELVQHEGEALETWCDEIAFSHDGRYLVAPDYDHTVKVWAVRDGKLESSQTLGDHTDSTICATFSRDGLLAVGCANGKVKLWDSATWTEQVTLECHDRDVAAICFSPDGRTLVTGSIDETVRIHRSASLQEVMEAERTGVDPLSVDLWRRKAVKRP